MYYLPLILTIIANLFYHIAQKHISENINPIFSLFVTYLVATVISAIILVFYKDDNLLRENLKELNWSAFLLGFSMVFLELGFLLLYRTGWNISTASIISTTILTSLLLPIGILFFKESINKINIIGIGVSVVGIILMNYTEK